MGLLRAGSMTTEVGPHRAADVSPLLMAGRVS